jgi:hypothetical protein
MADPSSASNDSPPREFWEDDLEMPIEHVLAELESDDFMQEWLDRRTGPQVRMLRYLLGSRLILPSGPVGPSCTSGSMSCAVSCPSLSSPRIS